MQNRAMIPDQKSGLWNMETVVTILKILSFARLADLFFSCLGFDLAWAERDSMSLLEYSKDRWRWQYFLHVYDILVDGIAKNCIFQSKTMVLQTYGMII